MPRANGHGSAHFIRHSQRRSESAASNQKREHRRQPARHAAHPLEALELLRG